MEVTAKILREVEFRDRLRGYDTDEVDEFLERVALGVEELQAELVEAKARVSAVEHQLEELPAGDDDAIRRTLVLAQRTADLAVKEANAEAERLVADARGEADRLLNDARAVAQQMRSEAETELARRVERLTERRELLQHDVAGLADLVDSERTRITEALTSLLSYVSDKMHISEDVRTEAARTPEPFPADEPLPPEADLDLDLDLPLPDVERELAEDASFARSPERANLADDVETDPDEELWERWARSGEPAPDLGANDPFHLGGNDNRGA